MKHTRHVLRWGISSGRLTIPDIAFAFWCFYQVRILTTFLLFENAPQIGTVVGDAVILFFLYVLTLIMLSQGKSALRDRPGTFGGFGGIILFAFIAWSGVSLAWTQAASLSSAFGYWFVMALEVLAVFMMGYMANIDDVAMRSLQGLVIGGLIVAGIAVSSDVTDVSGRLGDVVFLHPNALGYVLAIAALCAVYLMTRNDLPRRATLVWTTAAGILLAVLVSTLSKTSIAAFSGAVLVYLAIGRTGLGKKALFLLIATAIVVTTRTSISTYLEEYAAAGLGQTLTTVTGRTLIWERTWEMIHSRPILGYGFEAYRDVGPQIGAGGIWTAHNEALDLWFSLGVIGLIFAVLLYAAFFWQMYQARRWHKHYPLPQASLGFAFLVFALIYGLVEAATSEGLVFPLPLLLLMLMWVSSNQRQALTEDQHH